MAQDTPPSSANISSAVLAETDIPALITKLHPLLPFPIPLYRRLQYHLKHPNPASARAFVALASPTSPQTWLHSPDHPPGDHSAPFLVCHIDLSWFGETQVWTFASWELPSEPPATDEVKAALVNALFKTLATDPTFIPSRPTSPPEAHQVLKRTKKIVTPYSPSKVILGTLHLATLDLIPKHSHARTDPGFVKYIFTPSEAETSRELQLPPGYHFGDIRHNDEHLNLVLSRTVIPRSIATLRALGSIGVFFDGATYPTIEEADTDALDPSTAAVRGTDTRTAREIALSANAVDARSVEERLAQINHQPVAWGFLGKDASLTTLHCAPRHRGKGLAGAVTNKLFRMQDEVFGVQGRPELDTRMGHADVFESNMASRRVMEKLGGEARWVVAWVEVDVSLLVGKDGSILPEPKEQSPDIHLGMETEWYPV